MEVGLKVFKPLLGTYVMDFSPGWLLISLLSMLGKMSV
jgi:hypothetical protein